MGHRTITVPEDVHAMLAAQKQSGESFGELLRRRLRPPADTCGELLERLEQLPPPAVHEASLKALLAGRGRRS